MHKTVNAQHFYNSENVSIPTEYEIQPYWKQLSFIIDKKNVDEFNVNVESANAVYRIGHDIPNYRKIVGYYQKKGIELELLENKEHSGYIVFKSKTHDSILYFYSTTSKIDVTSWIKYIHKLKVKIDRIAMILTEAHLIENLHPEIKNSDEYMDKSILSTEKIEFLNLTNKEYFNNFRQELFDLYEEKYLQNQKQTNINNIAETEFISELIITQLLNSEKTT